MLKIATPGPAALRVVLMVSAIVFAVRTSVGWEMGNGKEPVSWILAPGKSRTFGIQRYSAVSRPAISQTLLRTAKTSTDGKLQLLSS